MKKDKLELFADRVYNSISRWCEKEKIEYNHSGLYSMYIKIDKYLFEDIKKIIKTFLKEEFQFSDKKIKKNISFSLMKNRLYILFKTPCNLN